MSVLTFNSQKGTTIKNENFIRTVRTLDGQVIQNYTPEDVLEISFRLKSMNKTAIDNIINFIIDNLGHIVTLNTLNESFEGCIISKQIPISQSHPNNCALFDIEFNFVGSIV